MSASPRPVLNTLVCSTRPGRVGSVVGQWAHALAEAHGGYLSVASRVGEGSTFTLALPVEKQTNGGRPLPEMPAAPALDEPPVDPGDATVRHESDSD